MERGSIVALPGGVSVKLAAFGGATLLGVGVATHIRITLGAIAVVVLCAAPKGWLLAGAILFSRSLGDMFVPTGGFSLTDLFLIVWLFRTVLRSDARLRLPTGGALLLGFLGWAWVSAIFQGGQPLALGRITLYGIVSLVIWQSAAKERRPVFVTIVGYAVVEFLLTAPDLLPSALGDSSKIHKLGVTVQDPHLLSFLFIAALCLVRSKEVRIANSWYRVGIEVAMVFGAAATFRRSIWLALIVVLVLPLVRVRKPSHMAVLACGAITVAWLMYSPITQAFGLNDSSRALRRSATEVSVAAIFHNPVLGVGWAAVGDENEAYSTGHNLPTYLAAVTGLPGAVLLLSWLAIVGRELWRKRRAMFWWLATILVTSVTAQPFFAGSLITIMLFIVVGLETTPNEREAPLPALPGLANVS